MQAALQDTRSGRNNDLGKESWSIEDYRHNMKNLGFSIPHFEVKRSMKIYHSREELQNAARSWAERLSLHNLSAEFPDVFAEYAIQNYQDPSSGIVFIPSKTVLLLGVKTELSLIP